MQFRTKSLPGIPPSQMVSRENGHIPGRVVVVKLAVEKLAYTSTIFNLTCLTVALSFAGKAKRLCFSHIINYKIQYCKIMHCIV